MGETLAMWHAEIERDYGALVAPIEAHSPAPELLAAAWLMLRATMVAPGLVDRTTKEAVAVAVSHANSCWYCAELHVTVLESLNERAVDSELSARAHHRIRRITEWARQPGVRRPFDDRHVPEIVGTIVVTHYLNRIATVFAASSTEQFAAVALHAHEAPDGGGTDMLPDKEFPAGFDWTRGQSGVASAFARASAAIEAAGQRAVPQPARAMVLALLADWHGETPGPEWLAELSRGLSNDDRFTARLALLTAIAPVQVDPGLLSLCRERLGGQALIELVSWASFVAARRVGEWVAPVRPPAESAPDSHRVLRFPPAAAEGDGGERSATSARRRVSNHDEDRSSPSGP